MNLKIMKQINFWGSLVKFISLLILIGLVIGCTVRESEEEADPFADLPLLMSDDFEDGVADGWKPNVSENWKVDKEEDNLTYQLIAPGPEGKIRAPRSWSILNNFKVSQFVFSGQVKCHADPANEHRDVAIFFHFQDPTHFYYIHLSAISDPLHNIVALVNGQDRVKINIEPPGESAARMVDKKFHEFKVTYNHETGEIKVYLDEMSTPILTAIDKTIGSGFVGVGSFDDTASFDNIKLWGRIVK